MSNTNRHKAEGKFNNGLIDLTEVPRNVLKGWNRYNFDKGEMKQERNKNRLKSLKLSEND